MWAPPYASADELAAWLGVPDVDAEQVLALEAAIDAASRAVDKATGRQFGKVAVRETHYYTAIFFKDRWVIDTDDLMTTNDLTIEISDLALDPGDYILTPRNAAPQGRPWTAIEILPGSSVKPTGEDVTVTAEFGWSSVPDAIKLATLIQAARFHERRQSVGGQLIRKEVDDVRLGWSASTVHELDPDVGASIAGYRKLWLAV